jgi:hypothetical protein
MRYSDENSQTFLTADFTVTSADKKYTFQRCLSAIRRTENRKKRLLGWTWQMHEYKYFTRYWPGIQLTMLKCSFSKEVKFFRMKNES